MILDKLVDKVEKIYLPVDHADSLPVVVISGVIHSPYPKLGKLLK